MIPSGLLRHIESLPSLILEQTGELWESTAPVIRSLPADSIQRVYIAGCGDSYHAAVGASLAFEQFSAIHTFAQSSMQFARYSASLLTTNRAEPILVIGISASGEVSRTIEALEQANRKEAITIAVTGDQGSTLARTADMVISSALPSLPEDKPGEVIPGARSYFASLLSLYTLAIRMGTARPSYEQSAAEGVIRELKQGGEKVRSTLNSCKPVVKHIARKWQNKGEFVFCGAGSNYGTALFSAAKILEACGDSALGQDLEEWAHLQYFARTAETPTIVISGGSSDQDRAQEVAVAARTIGRSAAIVSAPDNPVASVAEGAVLLPVASIREVFSPLVTCIPALLLASELSGLRSEPYFRGFSGGRAREGGGGISRIRTSHRLRS